MGHEIKYVLVNINRKERNQKIFVLMNRKSNKKHKERRKQLKREQTNERKISKNKARKKVIIKIL